VRYISITKEHLGDYVSKKEKGLKLQTNHAIVDTIFDKITKELGGRFLIPSPDGFTLMTAKQAKKRLHRP
jgi:nucleoid DNA-binding protein